MPNTVAVGVLSGSSERFLRRRTVLRAAWLQTTTKTMIVRFVLRCGTTALTSLQAADRGDTLCAPVASEKNGRLRGPLLALVWWLEHALTYEPRFVCKADDDVYLHLPDLEKHLLEIPASSAPFAWVGRILYIQLATSDINRTYTFHHFSETAMQARRKHPPELCAGLSNVSVCAGPLPFACGPFYALGTAAVLALMRNRTHRRRLDNDLAALRALPTTHGKVLDDVWLGAALWRFVGGAIPLNLFQVPCPQPCPRPCTSDCSLTRPLLLVTLCRSSVAPPVLLQLHPPFYSDDSSRFDAQRLSATIVWHNRLKFVNRIRVLHALKTARGGAYHCSTTLSWRLLRHHCCGARARGRVGMQYTEPGEATRATPKGLPWPIWVASSVMPSHGRRCEPYNRTSRRVDLMKRHVWVELGLELKDTFSLVEQA